MRYYDVYHMRFSAFYSKDSNELEELSSQCKDPYTQYHISKNRYTPESAHLRSRGFFRFQELICK